MALLNPLIGPQSRPSARPLKSKNQPVASYFLLQLFQFLITLLAEGFCIHVGAKYSIWSANFVSWAIITIGADSILIYCLLFDINHLLFCCLEATNEIRMGQRLDEERNFC